MVIKECLTKIAVTKVCLWVCWSARAGVRETTARRHQRQRQPPHQHAISEDLQQQHQTCRRLIYEQYQKLTVAFEKSLISELILYKDETDISIKLSIVFKHPLITQIK